MHEPSHAFLKQLLETPSPSGYERPIQDVVRAWAGQFADEVRTDRRAQARRQAVHRVSPRDQVTVALGYRPMHNGLAASPAMDDKVGLWTVMETLRLLRDRPLGCHVYCVSTVQEEIGLRGATT